MTRLDVAEIILPYRASSSLALATSQVLVQHAFYLLACTVMNAKLEADPANAANERGATDLMDGGGKEKGKSCAC